LNNKNVTLEQFVLWKLNNALNHMFVEENIAKPCKKTCLQPNGNQPQPSIV